jgi:regulator of sigma E protease
VSHQQLRWHRTTLLGRIFEISMHITPGYVALSLAVSSVVGIVAAGGVHVGLNFVKLLQFWVLLNVNLAIFNLIPILPLDGGKIVMGVLRRIHQPLRKLELPLTVGGWVLLLGLTVYATVLDIFRVAHGMLG